MHNTRSGRTRGRWARRIALSLSTILSSGLAVPALAQSAPPPYVDVDENGVDLVSGSYVTSLTEGSIGSGEGRVALTRTRNGPSMWIDNWNAGLMLQTVSGVTTAYVIRGSIADTFSVTGGTFTSKKGDGAALVANAPFPLVGYLYTAADGTQIQFASLGVTKLSGGYPVQGFACAQYSTLSCAIPVSITKPDGMKFTLSYAWSAKCTSGSGPTCVGGTSWYRLASVTSSAGYGLTMNYQSNSPGNFSVPQTSWYNKTSVTFSNSNQPPVSAPTVTYSTPMAGFSDYTDPGGRTWHFTGGNSSALTAIQRPGAASASTTIGYSTPGGYVSSVTIDGVTTTYSRVVSGSTATTTITDALSHQTIVEADLTKGRVTRITKVTSPSNLVTSYGVDSNGRVTDMTYPEGNKTVYAYDARGNVTSTTRKAKPSIGGTDIVTASNFDATCTNAVTCNQPNWTRDANLNQTDYAYDSTTGQVTSVTQPAAVSGGTRPQTRYSYTATGGVSMLTGISACQTGSSCTGTADEQKTTATYNSNLLPATVSKGAGDASLTATQTLTYDSSGNVLTVDGPLSGSDDTISYRYDAANNRVGTISPDPDGAGSLERRAVKVAYNADDQPTVTEIGTVNGTSDTDWAGFVSAAQSTSSYDANGYKTKDVVTTGATTWQVTQYGYDADGRPECTAVRMNLSSSLAACTPNISGTPDRIARTSYDTVGRVVKTQSAYGTTEQADDATATYSDNGKLATLTDGKGNRTTYVYDGFDRLSKTRYPVTTVGAGSSSTTDYELLGYDAAGSVTSRQLRDGQVIGYGYDLLGRLVSKNLPGSEPDVTYSYDLLGRLTGASQTGNALTFGYDALGRNTSQGGPLGTVSYQYDLAGQRIRTTWPDSFYVTYDHLVTGEVSAIKESGSTSLASFTYDNLGQRTLLTRGNGTTTSYGHDAVLRLSSLAHDMASTGSDVTQGFGYNAASQIVSQTRDNNAYAWTGAATGTKAYTLNGLNQVTAAAGTSLSHDGRGNTTAIGSNSFAYSSENLLTGATVSGVSSTLAYDPLLRLYQTTGSATARLQYDGSDLIAEYNASNALQKRYVFGPGTDAPLVEYDSAGNRTWLHADERGSIVARTNASGAATINSYDEYGIPASGNAGTFQYTGQAWLPDLGVYYYKARIYSPTLGRFLQTDPIGYEDGMNLYNHVGGDPVNASDPSGLKSKVPTYTGSMIPGVMPAGLSINGVDADALAMSLNGLFSWDSTGEHPASGQEALNWLMDYQGYTRILSDGTGQWINVDLTIGSTSLSTNMGPDWDNGLPRDVETLLKMQKDAKTAKDAQLLRRITRQLKMAGFQQATKQRGMGNFRPRGGGRVGPVIFFMPMIWEAVKCMFPSNMNEPECRIA